MLLIYFLLPVKCPVCIGPHLWDPAFNCSKERQWGGGVKVAFPRLKHKFSCGGEGFSTSRNLGTKLVLIFFFEFFCENFFWHPIGREKNDWLRLVRQNYLDGSHWLPGAKCHSRTQLTLGQPRTARSGGFMGPPITCWRIHLLSFHWLWSRDRFFFHFQGNLVFLGSAYPHCW